MRWTISDRLRRRIAISCLVVWSAAVAAGLLMLAPRMAPVREGTATRFWEVACGIELEPPAWRWGGNVLIDHKGWFVYDQAHLHGSDAFYVSRSEAEALLGDVAEALEQLRENGRNTPAVQAYVAWKGDDIRVRDATSLLRKTQEARDLKFVAERPDLLPNHVSNRMGLAERWNRRKTFWAALAFEWVLLTGLGVIAARPLLRSLGPIGWGAHWALLPPLSMFPVYLGYSVETFTSAGPSGGVLYPWLCTYLAVGLGSVSPADEWILEHLPQVLEPISAPIGSPMALSGMGMPGPMDALTAGLVLGVLVGVGKLLYRLHVAARSAFPPSTSS